MKKVISIFIVLICIVFLLVGCGTGASTGPVPTATMSSGEMAMQMMRDQLAAQGTQNAVGIQFTATQQIYNATSTAQAIEEEIKNTEQARADAQATANQERADARATQQRLDAEATQQQAQRDAQATATHEAFMAQQTMTQQAFQVTSTAQVIGTQTAYPQTQRAWEATATMDAAYGVAQATEAFAEAQSVEFGVERERVTNMTRAWVPWMGFIIALGVLSVIGMRVSRTRVVQKDAFGAMPGLVMDGVAVDLDAGMSARLLGDGSVEFKQHDDKITEREQKVKLIRAMPAGRQDVAEKLFELNDRRGAPVIEVIEAGTMSRRILDEIQDQVVEEE
jgi:hypothetical protein